MDKNFDVIKTISDPKLRDALNKLIENNLSNEVYVVPNIPEKKRMNAIKKMEIPSNCNILALFDTSISRSGKSGICVTNDGIYWTDDGLYWKERKIGSTKFDHMNPLNIEIDLLKSIKINGKELSLVQLLKYKEYWHFVDFLSSLLGLEQTPAGPLYKDDNAKIDLLIKALHDRKADTKVCIKIVETLGKIGDERSTEELIKSLKDPDTYLPSYSVSNEKVCIKISETLGKIGGDRATVTLIDLLDDMKTNGQLCLTIAHALGHIGDERSIKALKRATEDVVRGKRNSFGLLDPQLSLVAWAILERIKGENNGEDDMEPLIK